MARPSLHRLCHRGEAVVSPISQHKYGHGTRAAIKSCTWPPFHCLAVHTTLKLWLFCLPSRQHRSTTRCHCSLATTSVPLWLYHVAMLLSHFAADATSSHDSVTPVVGLIVPRPRLLSLLTVVSPWMVVAACLASSSTPFVTVVIPMS
ncbi:hypothetical protein L6452_08766 [Arctium lappa]|uniref:Uncharacterized protein n=1 Tax=Arctium lappa TaxID=4217 RepID=A0ACB9DIN1_ARCLA|nr:hypothetical protein L6452_08766 [Arctium lappa]